MLYKHKVFSCVCVQQHFRPKLHSDSSKAVPGRTNAAEIILHLLSEEGKTLPVSPEQQLKQKRRLPQPWPIVGVVSPSVGLPTQMLSNSGGKIML